MQLVTPLDPTADTIVAIASAAGGAARGIVRLSGDTALAVASATFTAVNKAEIAATRVASVVPGEVSLQPGFSPLPCDLYLWPTSRSYTGQPVVEFHTLGSPPLLEALLGTLCSAGARLAEPGEFTLRAFLAGRLDLVQAEAVLGVIDAQTDAALQTALQQLAGGLSRPLAQLRSDLLDLLADLEAGLDFVDEDIEFITSAALTQRLTTAAELVGEVARQLESRNQSADTLKVVLVGPPNAGKSSLFNALAGASALVSDIPGTTRDYLTAAVDLDGLAVELIDTAGTEVADAESIAGAAQRMTDDQSSAAHIRVICIDSTGAAAEELVASVADDAAELRVLTKCDRTSDCEWPQTWLRTSSRTGEGLEKLRAQLRERAEAASRGEGSVASTSVRCGESLRIAAECLEHARELAATSGGEEFIAAELRFALLELGKVVGAVYTDDVLDRIFSRFCIGK